VVKKFSGLFSHSGRCYNKGIDLFDQMRILGSEAGGFRLQDHLDYQKKRCMEKTLVSRETLNHLSAVILDSSITVHKAMGPGLLEAVYHHCLVAELRSREISVGLSVPVPLCYKGIDLEKDYIIDVLVENAIILELKSVDGLLPVHEAQIISYLKLADKRLGFLINFNVPVLKDGFRRFVNKF
jgi:GxxExxY protein